MTASLIIIIIIIIIIFSPDDDLKTCTSTIWQYFGRLDISVLDNVSGR